MKGFSVHNVENSEADRLECLGIRFPSGIWSVKGPRGVCAQRKGRCRTSEKRFLQDILSRVGIDVPAKVEYQVPRHVKDGGEDLCKKT